MAVPSFEGADRRSAPLRMRLLPDERLARRAEHGDRHALEEIDRRYRGDLYRFCLAMVGNTRDAETALEETLAKIRRGLSEGGRGIRLKPWLYRVARSETMDALCGPRGTGVPAPEQDRLLADLERLPQRERAVFVMRELSGLGFVEIGAAFGISAETAEQDHRTARTRLRRLDRKHGGLDLAALPPLPLVAGGGSGLAGTIAAWTTETVGAAVVVKATATVAVVAVTGLAVQERVGRDMPAPGGNDPGAVTSSAPRESTPQPLVGATVSKVAPRRDTAARVALSAPTAYVHQREPQVATPPEKSARLARSEVTLAANAVPEPPVDSQSQPAPQPHDTAEVPFEETAYEDPEEAIVSETNEAEPEPETAAPPAPVEELPGVPMAPIPAPPSPEPPASSPSPPTADRSWGRRGDPRRRGSRWRW